jgi:cytochrome c biogenesis protein CcdA
VLHLLALVLSIGLADGVNPTSIGPALFLASGPNPRRSVLRFTAGYASVLLLGGLVLTLGPGTAILSLVPRPTATTRYILETIAGTAMLLASGFFWLRRNQLSSRNEDNERKSSRRTPFVLGATISGIELPTAFPYFAAIVAVVGSGLNVGQQILLVVIYNFCFIAPLLAIIVVLGVAGDQAVRVLERARQFMQDHWPVLAAAVALVAGLFVTTLGVTGLELHAGGSTGSISRGVRHVLTHLR